MTAVRVNSLLTDAEAVNYNLTPMDLEELIARVESEAVGDTSLARIAAARDACADLNALGDEVVDHFVRAARRDGCSWAQIGSVLGVTRQGAQQRYGGLVRRLTSESRRRPSPVTRFGPDARRAVVEAQAAARSMGHDHVDTEHLLLGVLSAGPEALGATVLTRRGIHRASVEAEIAAEVSGETSPQRGHIAFAARAKKVLELSLREALALGDARIGTEHILLALLRETHGVAAQTLRAHGVDRAGVVSAILEERAASQSD